MIAAIRIHGLVGVDKKKEASLDSLMLRRKYNCVLLPKEESYRLNKVKELISFGEIDQETLKLLISKRAKKEKSKKNPENVEEIAKGLSDGKKLRDFGIKAYLRLSPPRGGFKKSTKLPYPKGILGNNKEISSLIKRMV